MTCKEHPKYELPNTPHAKHRYESAMKHVEAAKAAGKSSEEIHAIFKKWNMLFERALKCKKHNEVKLFDILFELIDVLSIVSIFFKNPQFKNEHEYRIVIVNVFGTDASKPTGVVEKNGLFVPYLEYKFSKDSVTSINIGPTFDENIFYTKIPLRY